MERRILTKVMVLGWLAGYSLAPPASTVALIAQQNSGFTMTPVVKRGDPRADGGTFFDCDSCDVRIAGEHGLNDLGQVVIFGQRVGECGIGVYVVAQRTGFRVADNCHASPFGRLSLFAGANINNEGQLALNAGPAINNTIVDMILLYSAGQLSKVVADGDQSPVGITFGSCGSSLPSINNKGEVSFSACFQDGQGAFAGNGVFVYSGGVLRKIAVGSDPSPVGGVLALTFGVPLPAHINDKGEVLFSAGQIDPDPTVFERFGLFLATADGIKKVELSKDTMPNGSKAADNSIGLGSLNNRGDVVFGLGLSGEPKVGIFLYSSGQISTIVLHRQPSPIGGTIFNLLQEVDDLGGPRINDNGTVALMANVAGDVSTEAVFLASPKAIVKVVAIGDRLPSGEKIRGITSFALNNLGQIAFFANASGSLLNPSPLGVFLATPNPPQITSVKLKRKKGALELRINGSAMITNDTAIEINGVPLGALDYPSDFREDGGFTTRVVSRDARLEQLMPEGQAVQITVFNSLTNLRSAPVSLAR